jgi:hypothetical protein
MYRIIVHITGEDADRHQFLSRSHAEAKRLTEELTRNGFWIPRSRPATFMPPSRIELVEVILVARKMRR